MSKDVPVENIDFKIPTKFLEDFFEDVYYSVIPEINLWNEKSSIIVEPIYTLQIKNFKLTDWKLIDKWIDNSFDKSEIRNYIKNDMSYADYSDIDQILSSISENIYEIWDNPILYPGERLSRLILEILPNNPDIIELINGVCHFHPIGDAKFSDYDCHTLRKIAGIMGRYGKEYIIGLIIAKSEPYELIEMIKSTKNQFIKYMMNDLSNTFVGARIFYPNGLWKNLDVTIE